MSQAEENVKNLILTMILAFVVLIQTPKSFWKLQLHQQLKIVPSYHPRQFKEKLMSLAEENMKNLILGMILAYLVLIQAAKKSFGGFTSTSSLKLFQVIIQGNLKENL